jgi:hypothetical protein
VLGLKKAISESTFVLLMFWATLFAASMVDFRYRRLVVELPLDLAGIVDASIDKDAEEQVTPASVWQYNQLTLGEPNYSGRYLSFTTDKLRLQRYQSSGDDINEGQANGTGSAARFDGARVEPDNSLDMSTHSTSARDQHGIDHEQVQEGQAAVSAHSHQQHDSGYDSDTLAEFRRQDSISAIGGEAFRHFESPLNARKSIRALAGDTVISTASAGFENTVSSASLTQRSVDVHRRSLETYSYRLPVLREPPVLQLTSQAVLEPSLYGEADGSSMEANQNDYSSIQQQDIYSEEQSQRQNHEQDMQDRMDLEERLLVR